MSELQKRMIRDMQLRNFSPDTQRGYLRAVTGLAKYYHCSPDIIGPKEIQDYIVYLLSGRKLSKPGEGYCRLPIYYHFRTYLSIDFESNFDL